MVNSIRLFALCLVLCIPAWALTPAPGLLIDSTYSGSWYNPLQDGHGLSVEVLPNNTTVVYWYVYDPDGSPVFLVTVGPNQGNYVTGDTYVYSGMRFGEFDPADLNSELWGTVQLRFRSCDSAELTYNAIDSRFGSGMIPMTRLVSIDGLKCKSSPVHGNYAITQSAWNEESSETSQTNGLAVLFADGAMIYELGTDTPGFGHASSLVGSGQWSIHPLSGALHFNASVFGSGSVTQVSASGPHGEDGFTTYTEDFGQILKATLLRSFQNGLTTETMSGTYGVAVTDVVIGEVIIASDGKLTGNINGCTLDGLITIPDINFNQAGFDLSLLNCENAEAVQGAAVLDASGGVITLIGTGTSRAYVWNLF